MKNYLLGCYISAQLNMEERIKEFAKNQRGVTAIEYALIAVAMATLLASVLGDKDKGFLGALNHTFEAIAAAISSVTIAK
ncbi:pilus assembly protein PilA [[Pantoea] beijingensis]|uniref:Pilus assembly protein PilA n=1 Tax=[Pantoea] beijingensis TaxID=1324864 RepID=A0A443IGX4_9GAMM|nr:MULTISPECIES: Flp family type IVb pilin [Erwiniaceae]RWR03309.1 pilus assembly protein PilA [[Pantoea] beijingensis]